MLYRTAHGPVTAGVATKWDANLNYSLGLEGGVNLGLFHVGAEVGKFFGKFTHAGFTDFDASGVYYKVLVGVGF